MKRLFTAAEVMLTLVGLLLVPLTLSGVLALAALAAFKLVKI